MPPTPGGRKRSFQLKKTENKSYYNFNNLHSGWMYWNGDLTWSQYLVTFQSFMERKRGKKYHDDSPKKLICSALSTIESLFKDTLNLEILGTVGILSILNMS